MHTRRRSPPSVCATLPQAPSTSRQMPAAQRRRHAWRASGGSRRSRHGGTQSSRWVEGWGWMRWQSDAWEGGQEQRWCC